MSLCLPWKMDGIHLSNEAGWREGVVPFGLRLGGTCRIKKWDRSQQPRSTRTQSIIATPNRALTLASNLPTANICSFWEASPFQRIWQRASLKGAASFVKKTRCFLVKECFASNQISSIDRYKMIRPPSVFVAALPREADSLKVATAYAATLHSRGFQIGAGGNIVFIAACSDDKGIALTSKEDPDKSLITPRVIYQVIGLTKGGKVIDRKQPVGKFLERKSKYFVGTELTEVQFQGLHNWEFPPDYRKAIIDEILAKGAGIVPQKKIREPEDAILSPAELDAIRLAARGLSYKQIAKQLGKSVRTIEHQLRHARQRMDASNQADLIMKCSAWL